MEDIAEENEPECEPEPVSPPLEEHPEPTRNGESSGGDSSQDAESDADDWTRRPPWNTLDIVDEYMIGQLPDQSSAAANESMATDEEPSGQEIVAVDAELEDVRELKRQRDLDGQPRRMTLRSEAERHSPTRLDDYHVYASYCARDQTTDPIATNKKWHIKDVQVPQSYSQAVRSPQREEWLEDIYQEVEAMFSKGVFVMIDEKKMPSEANLLSTMWRYRPKTDLEGRQDVTFRVVVAVAATLHPTLYQGDFDTAYLNANLKIKQYVRGIPWFPCPKGKVYRVDHALYGQHQSGAEWFEEVDKFLKTLGYASTETEPCLYVYYKGGVLALIPLYVDDVVLATNSEDYKTTVFAAFDAKYGFKDGGLAIEFFGVQVEQNEKGIWINQE
ncbi:hypothetical protein PC110_g14220 [Phytophthora cactorum]|uniref:Reverse transcriptase Ty1/copia-type domain-containing protein n=1 Tax=Phytophthora cactorum TaxID=29920 RepID=A0A329RY82_9STRA|nr:hypothetical protein PC110_g14220 [Phytophthora cactorum]